MIKGKNISKDFVSRKIFLLLAIAVILILLGIHFWIKSSSDISVKDAEKQIEENLRAAGVSEYEKIDLQAYEKQAVVVAGVADCTMNYEEREDMRSLLTELIGGTPEQLPEEYSRRSAVAWADEINTPLLIFHTTGDDKVSIKQADKLVKQLKKNQKDYEYVTFESNIHGDLRKTDVEKIRKWLQT